MSQIAIVIVNWNTGELLAKCLKSIAALPVDELSLLSSVIIVDNNSTDTSLVQAEVIAGQTMRKPRVQILRMGRNAGFAAANNYGIDWILEHSSSVPHVLLLNPDTEVQPGVLRTLIDTFVRFPEVGIVGPALRNPDGSSQHSVRSFPTFFTLVLYLLKMGWFWERFLYSPIDYSREQIVDQVMGACFCIRNDLIKAIGGLDEQYFLWFEEVDFCYRARIHGFMTLYTPNAQVIHHGGVSFHQLVGLKKSIPWATSLLRYARRYFSITAWIFLVLLAPLSVFLSLPAALRHGYQKRAL